MVASLWQDLRYAARGLRNTPLFTLAAVITLALGIGATSALFTVVDAVLLRPLPFPNADRIVSISEIGRGSDQRVAASTNIRAWQRQARTLQNIALYTSNSAAFSGGGDPIQLNGARASAELFSMLPVHPLLGRTFAADEAGSGGPDVVVLGRGFWQQSFGADSGVIGRSMILDGKSYTVIGVIDERRALPRGSNYWLPLAVDAARPSIVHYYSALARLKPGVSVPAARADLAAINRSSDAARPAAQRGGDVAVMTLHDRMFGSVKKPLAMLFGAVVFLLLIACANVANLMLARGASRRREVAVRLALGASRWRLLRQLLIESVLLATIAAAVGALIPVWAVGMFVKLSPDTISRVSAIRVNGEVVAFTAAVAVLTGLLFGILPAWSSTRVPAFDLLKDGARAAGSLHQQRTRRALVVAELATALVLMTGAGLLTRSFINVLAVDVGFAPDHLTSAAVFLPRARYASEPARRSFFELLEQRVRGIPGVQSVALSGGVPGYGFSMTTSITALMGRADSTQVAVTTVAREYPRTVGLQLVAGRLFGASDGSGAAASILLSVAAAKALFPEGHAVGQQLPASDVTDRRQPAVVVGVVKNVPQIGVDVTPLPQVYFAGEQVGGDGPFIVVRSSVDPGRLEATIRHAVAAIDPLQPVASFEQIDRVLARSIAPRRLNFLLIDVFAGLALLLSVIGLYATMAFQVAQRTREVGIRMALGATGGAVRRLILQQGLRIVATGCLAGLALSIVASRILSGFLYGVTAYDPGTFLAAPAVLCGVAILACYVPARRATSVDPVVALRNE